ncbi:MAG: hypothetical protein LBI34_01565 [Puniceicoccales bacterium]|jgi:hypothetical protein|nr:hypothetical protein [Puniceicoccales bacterium]
MSTTVISYANQGQAFAALSSEVCDRRNRLHDLILLNAGNTRRINALNSELKTLDRLGRELVVIQMVISSLQLHGLPSGDAFVRLFALYMQAESEYTRAHLWGRLVSVLDDVKSEAERLGAIMLERKKAEADRLKAQALRERERARLEHERAMRVYQQSKRDTEAACEVA